MFNRDAGKKAGRVNLPLSDDKTSADDDGDMEEGSGEQPSAGGDGKGEGSSGQPPKEDGDIGEGSGGQPSMDAGGTGGKKKRNREQPPKYEDDIDHKGVKKDGVKKKKHEETRQTSVSISLDNLGKLATYYEMYGSSTTWVVNTALSRFFEQADI